MQINSVPNMSFKGVLRVNGDSISSAFSSEYLKNALNHNLLRSSLRLKQIEKQTEKLENTRDLIDKRIVETSEKDDLLQKLNEKSTDIFILNNGNEKQVFLLQANDYGEDSYIPTDKNGILYETIIDITQPAKEISSKIKAFFQKAREFAESNDNSHIYTFLTETRSGQDLYRLIKREYNFPECIAGEENNLAEEIFQNHGRRSKEITLDDMIE